MDVYFIDVLVVLIYGYGINEKRLSIYINDDIQLVMKLNLVLGLCNDRVLCRLLIDKIDKV